MQGCQAWLRKPAKTQPNTETQNMSLKYTHNFESQTVIITVKSIVLT